LAANINSDISYVLMNFSLDDDLILSGRKHLTSRLSLCFNQITVSDFFSIEAEPDKPITDTNCPPEQIFFSLYHYDLEMNYSKHSRLKRVASSSARVLSAAA